jgi:hypothetical protein
MNCCTALWSIGPRQMTAWSFGTSMPMESAFTPCAIGRNHLLVFGHFDGARLHLDAEHLGQVRTVDVGVDHPDARALLRKRNGQVHGSDVDLPTPPLPAPTAITLRMPGMPCAAHARRAPAPARSC